MTVSKTMVRLATLAFAGCLALSTFAGVASAKSTSVKDTCTTCQFKPAIAHTASSSSTTTTTKSHTHITKTLRAQVTQYEKVKHIRVAINGGRPMSGAGCVDPEAMASWGFHGGPFINADRFHRELPDNWESQWRICGWHIVKNWHGHKGTWAVGQKMNCRNTPIAIPIQGTPAPRVKTKVIEVTLKTFRSDYDKVFTKTTTTTSNGGTTTTYSCEAGWTLTSERGSPECKYCPTSPCPPPPPPPPPTPTYACTNLAFSTSSLSATATLSVSTSGGAAFKSATISWGDTQSTSGGLSQSHTYASAGSYSVAAVATFTLPNGSSASANCTGSVTVSPPQQSAVVSNLTHLQNPTGVLAGNTYNICADVSTSTTMTVIFSADNGSVSGGSSTVNGTQRVCASYTAPNDAVTAPDTYHIKVFYNGQLMAQDSWTVTVNPQPAG